MSKYRKKPVVIDAFKLGVDYIPDWFMDAVTANKVILYGTSSGFNHVADTNADIHTLEGWHHANYGDYIIRGVKGELYPCKPDIFDMTYDVADKPKTRADRIRAMSDEELAEFLVTANPTNCLDCDFSCGWRCQPDRQDYSDTEKCVEGKKRWLKQPADGE